jgi:hypothetical protein
MNAAAIGKLPNTVAASDAAAGPAEPVLAPAPVVLNEVETPAGDLMARTGDGQYDDVQNADAIAGTDILREALGHAEVTCACGAISMGPQSRRLVLGAILR